ncbi:hypothetical protein M8J75_015543 [Diaphorina citri]|nr:hypothetical protein M8J75_015543 [Diaphorina citri]
MDSIDREPPDIPPDSSPGNTAPDPISRNILLYSSEHKFNWYKLLIQAKPSDNVDTSRKPYVRALAVSKILGDLTNQSKDVTEIRRLNRTKFLIICSTAACANKIVLSEKVRSKFVAFIPQIYLTRTAILRDVDVDIDGEKITDDEIKNNLDTGNFKLLTVQRLNRKVVVDGKANYVPSTSVKLVFDGQDMPKYVYLWYTRLQCEPFIQNPIQCFTCYKFGHVSKYCQTKSSLCKRCFQIELDDHSCDLVNLKCLNCHGPHNVNSRSCPEYERQRNIKLLMSTRNMCFPEAADLIPSSKPSYAVQTKNSFEVLGEDISGNFSEFPKLNSKNQKGQREFIKYVPPSLPSRTIKRKTINETIIAKKNRNESVFVEKMKDITKPQQFYSDKEVSTMFYKNAENIKNSSDRIQSSQASQSQVQSFDFSPFSGNQGKTNYPNSMKNFRPMLYTMQGNKKSNSNNVDKSVDNNDDIQMSESSADKINDLPLGSYANVFSPDLS